MYSGRDRVKPCFVFVNFNFLVHISIFNKLMKGPDYKKYSTYNYTGSVLILHVGLI